ncbi:hypothetical protein E2C01_023949 [Portunus trituberculatus]|uniref:Uncharacterized protein n=1 Tax=Portunus trituberculatus TaxID=210409 RepID=A0A5B7E993_PORTR|nr:hypothetical protein [Portunus trituberculatus]
MSSSPTLEDWRRDCSTFTSAFRDERQDSRLVRGGGVGVGAMQVFSMSCVRPAMSSGRGDGITSTSEVKGRVKGCPELRSLGLVAHPLPLGLAQLCGQGLCLLLCCTKTPLESSHSLRLALLPGHLMLPGLSRLLLAHLKLPAKQLWKSQWSVGG